MDFLCLPSEPTSKPPRVAYVADSLYDDGDFFTYPARAGWPQASPDEDRAPFWMHERREPSNNADLEGFLQNWIFVGLLHSVLSPHGLYVATEYIAHDDEGAFLNTNSLSDRLQSWLDLIRHRERTHREQEAQRVLSCLKVAAGAIQVLSLESHSGFTRESWLCFAAVTEFVQEATQMVVPEIHAPRFCLPIEFNITDVEHMMANGWCPSEIAFTQLMYQTNATRFFVRHMRKPQRADGHRDCNNETCARLQIDLDTYHPQHVNDMCECELTGPDPKQVDDCLLAGSFPVLKVSMHGPEEVFVEVIPYEKCPGYVAISHVWADGLGNPTRIQLPRCQLVHLQELVRDVKDCTFESIDENDNEIKWTETRDLYLWCDSLCIPVYSPGSPEKATTMKQLGLEKLREIYTKASYVLVLDSSLQCLSVSSMGPVEVATRILTSGWMRRLWTFQEAGLAKTLIFHLKHQIISFRDVWHNVKELSMNDLQQRIVALNATSRCAGLRHWFRESSRGGKDMAIAIAVNNLSYRRVSVASDEPICIAAVFELSVDRIVRADTNQRLRIFWELMSKTDRGIPPRIVFNDFPRIVNQGYRWAPKTLQRRHTDPIEVLGGESQTGKGILTGRGLRINAAGWKLKMLGVLRSIPNTFGAVADTEDARKVIFARDSHDRWYCLTQYRQLNFSDQESSKNEDFRMPSLCDLLEDSSKDWVVILDKSLWNQGHKALLAYRALYDSSLYTSRSAMLIWVRKAHPAMEKLWSRGYGYAMALRRSWTLRFIHAVHRCETMLSWLAHCLPSVAARPIARIIRRILYYLAGLLWHRLRLSILSLTMEAFKSPSLQTAWREAGHDPSKPLGFGVYITHPFMGKIAVVGDQFSATQEWYVD